MGDYENAAERERQSLLRIKEVLGGDTGPGGLISDTVLAIVERLLKLEKRVDDLTG